MKNLNGELYASSDLSLISALYLYGYEIDSIDKENPRKAVFCVKRDERLNEVLQAYFSNSLKVNALTYFNAIKAVKSRLYN
jgi:hypothetical protein